MIPSVAIDIHDAMPKSNPILVHGGCPKEPTRYKKADFCGKKGLALFGRVLATNNRPLV